MIHLADAYVLEVIDHAKEAIQRMGPVVSARLCQRHDVVQYVYNVLEEEPDCEAMVGSGRHANG
jgi:hypothetical protein